MARRKDAAQREQGPAEEPQAQSALQKQAGTRRRRQQQQQKPPAAAAAAAAAATAPPSDDPVDSMAWWRYYPWQYGGLVLGGLACCNTVLFYDQEDPQRVLKLGASMALGLVALLVHETRPFKRMTYGDKAREQGHGPLQMLGL